MEWKWCAWILILAVALAAPAAWAQTQPPGTFGTIVVFRADANLARGAADYVPDDRAAANPPAWGYLDRGVAGTVQSLERAHGFLSDNVYSAALRGFSAYLTPQQMADLQKDPRIAYIEEDGEAHTAAQTLPWGVDRIDADLSSTRAGDGTGAVTGVNLYVLDTGVDATHPDLNVVASVNFAYGPNTDCNGHGTNVAGIAAARDNDSYVVGVAPGAPITSVRVLGCGGFGFWSMIIKGIDWVTANASKPAVANMSIVGGVRETVDQAVRNSAASGVLYAIAAGNNAADACRTSPGRTGAGATNGIVTMAATDQNDQEASFSNFGPCVDLWGPGVSILSTRNGGGTSVYSGTSQATPHAAGTAVLYLAAHPTASPANVENALKRTSTATGTFSKDGRAIRLVYAGRF
jgi:subtilisin family serine protease